MGLKAYSSQEALDMSSGQSIPGFQPLGHKAEKIIEQTQTSTLQNYKIINMCHVQTLCSFVAICGNSNGKLTQSFNCMLRKGNCTSFQDSGEGKSISGVFFFFAYFGRKKIDIHQLQKYTLCIKSCTDMNHKKTTSVNGYILQ